MLNAHQTFWYYKTFWKTLLRKSCPSMLWSFCLYIFCWSDVAYKKYAHTHTYISIELQEFFTLLNAYIWVCNTPLPYLHKKIDKTRIAKGTTLELVANGKREPPASKDWFYPNQIYFPSLWKQPQLPVPLTPCNSQYQNRQIHLQECLAYISKSAIKQFGLSIHTIHFSFYISFEWVQDTDN